MSSLSHFENAVFRYRSIDALLGEFEELERQTVYFSKPEKLNDPMEGLRQVYWRGDRTTWRNLLRHYVICLHNRLIEALLTEDDGRLAPQAITVFQSLENFATPQARSLCKACIDAVESGDLHAALLDLLANADRDIGLSELQQLLRTVHTYWLNTVHRILSDQGLAPRGGSIDHDPKGIAAILNNLQDLMPQVREQLSDSGIEIIHEVQRSMGEQTTLLAAFQHSAVLKPKHESLIFEFTPEYLAGIMKLVYPPWNVSCFSVRHDNAAMWSYYAGDHKGCCLVFRKHQTDTGFKLRLNGPNGYGSRGVSRGTQDFPLDAVRYTVDQQRVEFFTNIGRLPLDATLRDWFRDDSGHTSPLAGHLIDDRQEEWRKAYWQGFVPPLLRKLPDWRHEEEFRIVLSDILGIHDTDEGRTFTYDYDTLDGIIFGINTTLSDRVRIMAIVHKKLAARTIPEPFKFYQAHFNSKSGRIEAHHLSLIDCTISDSLDR